MSEVKRYDIVCAPHDEAQMEESQDGDYVLYSDHLAAVEELTEALRGMMELADKGLVLQSDLCAEWVHNIQTDARAVLKKWEE